MNMHDLKNRLKECIDYFKAELSKLRAGKVSTSLIEGFKVEAYGSSMTLREVGTISVLDAHTLQVVPWDKGLLDPIVKAISLSDLHLNPVNKGDSVLIPIPELTEERRVEFTKVVGAKLEEAKVVARNIRQDAMKSVEQSFENKEFGEDDKFSKKEEIEKLVKSCIGELEQVAQSKKEDILRI